MKAFIFTFIFYFSSTLWSISVETLPTNLAFAAENASQARLSNDTATNLMNEYAISEEQLESVARSKAWQRLLHYMPDGKNELDGGEFFFAKDGRTNAIEELKASLKAMNKNIQVGRLKQHPQCAFPERYRFLKASFNLQIKDEKCPLFEEFIGRFHSPKAVSLIFSSAYPNNPASMFGHTFLKIESTRKSDLLDYGINYAAGVPEHENPFAFMYFGVFGGYKGQWSMEPYFTKINTYINSESRDLWEYELSLTESETLRLLAHLWELEVNSHFMYYFFDKNCSYQILRAIEAIRLDWQLSQHRIYVIPGETIKRLYAQPGVVKSVNHRSSLYNQLEASYHALSSEEQKNFKILKKRPKQNLQPAQTTTARSANDSNDSPHPNSLQAVATLTPSFANALSHFTSREIDVALLHLKYTKLKKRAKFSSEDQAFENQLLEERLKRGEPTLNVPIADHTKLSRPEIGHDPYSFTLLTGVRDFDPDQTQSTTDEFVGVRLKSAYHDLMAKDDGFAPFSEIDFPWIELRYTEDELRVHQVGGVNITSLFPVTVIEQQPSWRIRVLFDTEQTLACKDCLLLRGEAGAGYAVGNKNYRLYLMALARQEFHRRLYKGYRTRPGAEASWIWRPHLSHHRNYKMRLTAIGLTDINPQTHDHSLFEFHWAHSYSVNRNNEIRLSKILSYADEISKPELGEIKIEWLNYFQ